MDKRVRAVTGTQDLIGTNLAALLQVSKVFATTLQRLNISPVQTPILEKIEVFEKNLGETSDIVQKEMFTLKEGDGVIVLRPEGTAGVIRAMIDSGWQEKLPLKVGYDGPMFRRETPQKGRFRQFDQVGVEFLGYNSQNGDAQCLFSAITFLTNLGVLDKVSLEINFLGTEAERSAYKIKLVEFLETVRPDLSEYSQMRLNQNPLRILDSKSEIDQKILKSAPVFSDFYEDGTKQQFLAIKSGLDALGVKYQVNPLLVRGLDYYNGLVFEFVSSSLGSQNTVLAGGRYDKLSESMGGPSVPSIGWAAGKERLSYLIASPLVETSLVGIVVTDDAYLSYALQVASQILTRTSYSIEIPANESLGKKFKKLNKLNAKFVVVIGPTEVEQNKFSLKDMSSGEQFLLDEKDLLVKIILSSMVK